MHPIEKALQQRILVIDGAMGTMIQRHKLTEADYRGQRFANWHTDVKGNNDLLCITKPDIIIGIHKQYLEAGADIIETNTFSSTKIAQADYDLQSIAYELNVAAAQCARKAIEEFSAPAHSGSPNGGEKEENEFYEDADPALYGLLKEFAASHRKNATEAETVLWNHLRAKQLDGIKFRRQHIIGQFITDFVCLSKKLIIEVDGLIHQLPESIISDAERTEWFTAKGYTLIRFTNKEVLYDIDNVIRKIHHQLDILPFAEKKNYTSPPLGEKKGAYVAGAIGPLNKTLSLSPDVNNPGFRAVSFDEVVDAYYEQISGLVDGGVDVLLVETIFDTLNAKAAIYAIKKYFRATGKQPLPVMISGTITDASGRTLSGQTLEAFYISVMHAKPLSIGLNCALGAAEMRSHIEELSSIAACYTSAYPNAGLPNAMGEYDEQPHQTAHFIEEWAQQGFVNIVGGCCGTTPDHIRHIAQKVKHLPARQLPVVELEVVD